MFQIRLKELREEQKISQKELAEKLGMSQSTIGMWESGKREPNFETMKALANFFDVTIDYLVGNVSQPFMYLDDKKILGEINSLDGYKSIQQEQTPPQRKSLRSIARLEDANITEGEDKQIEDFISYLLTKKER